MSETRTLSLLNCILITFNFTWIVVMDNSQLFGESINSTIQNYPTFLTPAPITFKIWTFLASTMIVVGLLMYFASRNDSENLTTLRKIDQMGSLLIFNQLFCGMSMVFKINDEFIPSFIFSTACLISLLIINKRIEIRALVSNSICRYFVRLGFSMYSGWMIFVLAFNSAVLISKYNLIQDHSHVFWVNVIILILCAGFTLYYAYVNNLPAISAVLAWGIFGIWKQHQEHSSFSTFDMTPLLVVILIIALLATAYGFYRCNLQREMTNTLNQRPPSIS